MPARFDASLARLTHLPPCKPGAAVAKAAEPAGKRDAASPPPADDDAAADERRQQRPA
jgi:hypothetical protein